MKDNNIINVEFLGISFEGRTDIPTLHIEATYEKGRKENVSLRHFANIDSKSLPQSMAKETAEALRSQCSAIYHISTNRSQLQFCGVLLSQRFTTFLTQAIRLV